MWLFMDSADDHGSASIKAVAISREELNSKIADYVLKNEVHSTWFEVVYIENNEVKGGQ